MEIMIIGSGSSGNCVLIKTDETCLLLDAGFSCRQIVERLDYFNIKPSQLDGILVTHEHSDHIKGLRVLANKYEIPVYANMDTAEALRYKKHAPEHFNLFMTGQKFVIGDFEVTPFSVPHDAADATAYTLTANGKKASFVTDLGLAGRMIVHHVKNSDFMLIESNYDYKTLQEINRPWSIKQRIASRIGHLANEDAMKLMVDAVGENTQKVVFGHISRDSNSIEKVQSAVNLTLDENDLHGRFDVEIAVQNTPLGPFKL